MRSKEAWKGLAQRVVYRQTALNILRNHFEEAVALNKRLPRFLVVKNQQKIFLTVEDFLFALAKAELPYKRETIEHLRRIYSCWPVGTVVWEELPAERNPYHVKTNGFVAKTHDQLCVSELVSENRDLLLSTARQGREAFELGLSEAECELSDEVLRAAWLVGFNKAKEKKEKESDSKGTEENR